MSTTEAEMSTEASVFEVDEFKILPWWRQLYAAIVP